MSSSALFPLLVFLLGTFGVGALLLAAFYPRVAGPSALDRRFERLAALEPASGAQPTDAAEGSRKRSVEETLREAERKQRAKQKANAKPPLAVRMRQAELAWSKTTYWLVSGATGLVVLVTSLMAIGLGVLPSIGFGIAGGLLLPHFYVNMRRNRRFKRFAAEFPNAVDVIVRGIKSGLPLVDTLKIVAAEAQDPVKSEFRSIVDDQTMGMPLDEAVQRLPQRIPTPEASFFAIVIAIQSRTGGSLSEALGNLSRVLRERKKMKAKIKAMSSEAKASGGIIGALPIFVGAAVYMTSPKYISLLFTHPTGNIVLVVSGVWMLMGILVMRKMINFDF